MFETITEDGERGQVGIGTLIVFIAMVLVAAIAAGVLINTAGVLQTQASDTGSETQEQVANQIEVLHASGDVDEDTGTIDTVDMTLMKSAGSNEIDLRSMTLQYTSSQTDDTLTYGDESTVNAFSTAELSGDNDGESLTTKDDRVELSLNTTLLESDANGEVSVTSDGDSSIDDPTLGPSPMNGGNIVFEITENSDDDLEGDSIQVINTNDSDAEIASKSDVSDGDEITVHAEDFDEDDQLNVTVNGENSTEVDSTVSFSAPDELHGLTTGSSATVALVDQSGAQFTYGISVPSTFGTASVVEV